MTELNEWQKIAREMGAVMVYGYGQDADETGERIALDYELDRAYLNAKDAAKEILRLRNKVKVLEQVREAGSKVESLMDDPEHTSNDYYACKSLIWPRQAPCDCGAQDQIDAMDELRKALALTEQQQETNR